MNPDTGISSVTVANPVSVETNKSSPEQAKRVVKRKLGEHCPTRPCPHR